MLLVIFGGWKRNIAIFLSIMKKKIEKKCRNCCKFNLRDEEIIKLCLVVALALVEQIHSLLEVLQSVHYQIIYSIRCVRATKIVVEFVQSVLNRFLSDCSNTSKTRTRKYTDSRGSDLKRLTDFAKRIEFTQNSQIFLELKIRTFVVKCTLSRSCNSQFDNVPESQKFR